MYMKLEEKRVALRQGVKLLDEQIKRIQAENLNLKKGRISIMMIFLCLFLYVVRTIFLLAGWVWVLQKECLFIVEFVALLPTITRRYVTYGLLKKNMLTNIRNFLYLSLICAYWSSFFIIKSGLVFFFSFPSQQ